jgi:hypothetical protein
VATSIGLGVQFTANASGMTKGLSQAEKAIQQLGRNAADASKLFDSFTGSSAAAGAAQQQVATDLAFLSSAFRTGQVSAQEYAAELLAITQSAQTQAAAFAEGAAITSQVATAEEKRAAKLQRLAELLAQNVISEQTYARAAADASGAAQAAADAAQASEQKRSKAIADGAAVAASVRTEQEKREAELQRLSGLLEQGAISEETYSRAVAVASGAQAQAEVSEKQRAATLSEGVRLTEQYLTAEEKRAAKLDRLSALLAEGAISEETFARASREGSSAHAEAAQAEEARAKSLQRAAQITQANLGPQQKYDAQAQELGEHLAAGRISQDTYNSALSKAATEFAKATLAADKFGGSVDGAGDGGTLKFNELSGVLSALPGPIGNVAGRLSGLSSAGEGLSKVFGSGAGLSGGLTNIGASVAGLVNPFTVGLAAVAAFGAGASAVASGLLSLEDRVETLGNTADKLGVSFEFIQTLEEAGRRSGVGIESVSSAFGKLQKTLAGADEESKAATAALAKLGVSFSDLENLSPQEQIRLVGEKLQGIEDPAKRTAAAMQIFGKSGADLIPFFNNLTPAADDIERLGRALTEIDRGRIDDFGAGVDALGVATQGLGQTLLLPFVGLGEGISKGAAEFIAGVTAIVDPIAQVLEPALTNLGRLFEVAGILIGQAGKNIGAFLAPIAEIVQAISQSLKPFNDGIVDLARAAADLSGSFNEFLASSSVFGVIADNIGAIGDTVGRVAVIIGTAFSQVGEYIGGLVARFGELVAQSPLLESIGGIISKVFGSVSTVFSTISEAIGGVVGRLLTIAEGFLGIEQSANDAGESAVVALEFTPPEGFADYEKAIQSSRTALNAAIEESAQFGQAGFDAAYQFQTALEELQAQADKGILNETAYKAEVEKATEAYRSQIGTIKEAQKAEEEKLKAVERAADAVIAADQRRADSFIQSQGLGGEDPRTKAAEDLLAITRQIDEAETAIVEARAAGDRAAEEAAVKRLAILDQAEAAAQQQVQFGFTSADANKAIEDTRKKLDEVFTFDNFQLAPDAFTAAQKQLQDLTQQLQDNTIDPETYKLAADALRSGFEDAVKNAEKLGELQLKYAEAAAEIDQERLDKLAKVSQEPLKIEDVRTSAGASEFLRLASGREDPAVEEYRKQLTKLDEIKKELAKVGGTVEMIGA